MNARHRGKRITLAGTLAAIVNGNPGDPIAIGIETLDGTAVVQFRIVGTLEYRSRQQAMVRRVVVEEVES